MANNRLWIVDGETGEEVLLAKGHGAGWELWDAAALEEWLKNRDYLASDLGGPKTVLKLRTEADL
jgi:hypothetical protein